MLNQAGKKARPTCPICESNEKVTSHEGNWRTYCWGCNKKDGDPTELPDNSDDFAGPHD